MPHAHKEASPSPAPGASSPEPQKPRLEPKLRKKGGGEFPAWSHPSAGWRHRTPGPQQNSKLVRSCLAVRGDV